MEGGDKGGYPDGEWFVYISYFKLFTLSFCLLHQSSGILLAPNFPLPQFGWEEEGRRQKRKFTWNQNSDVRSLRNLVNTSYIHVKQTQHSFNLHIIHHRSAIHEMYSSWSKGREINLDIHMLNAALLQATNADVKVGVANKRTENLLKWRDDIQLESILRMWYWLCRRLTDFLQKYL